MFYCESLLSIKGKDEDVEMLKGCKFTLNSQSEKESYADLEIKVKYFEESFIRTSIGDDGNEDSNWDDENANPKGNF